MFYCAGQLPRGGGAVVASRDGGTWKIVHTDKRKGVKKFYDIAQGDGQMVVCGGGGSHGGAMAFAYSQDGTDWQGGTHMDAKGSSPMFTVGYGDSHWAAYGGVPAHNGVYYSHSKDGKNWAKPIKPDKGGNRRGRRMAFGNGVFVTIGDRACLRVSPDGVGWQDPMKRGDEPACTSLCFGKGVFVAGGMHGEIHTSRDGRQWSKTHEGEIGEHINEIVHTGDQFVGIGINATFFSKDGKRWRKEASNVRPARACYGNGRFVCHNARGTKIDYSRDAITWKRAPEFKDALLIGGMIYVKGKV